MAMVYMRLDGKEPAPIPRLNADAQKPIFEASVSPPNNVDLSGVFLYTKVRHTIALRKRSRIHPGRTFKCV